MGSFLLNSNPDEPFLPSSFVAAAAAPAALLGALKISTSRSSRSKIVCIVLSPDRWLRASIILFLGQLFGLDFSFHRLQQTHLFSFHFYLHPRTFQCKSLPDNGGVARKHNLVLRRQVG